MKPNKKKLSANKYSEEKYNRDRVKAVRQLKLLGVKDITSPKQIQNRSIALVDPKQPDYKYIINLLSGYARKEQTSDYDMTNRIDVPTGTHRYPLNPIDRSVDRGTDLVSPSRLLYPGNIDALIRLVKNNTKYNRKVRKH